MSLTGGLASSTNPGNLPEYLSRYRIAARAAGLSQATVNHVSLCVTLFSRYLGEAASVQKVRAEDYRSFLVSLQERRAWEGTPFVKPRPLSPDTINTYARGIHSFWSWLKREGLIRKNPLAAVPAPRVPRRLPRAFTEEEVKKILKVVKNRPRERAMVQLFLDSGIRLSECLGLALKDVDFVQGRLRVYGKGSKERYAYFSRQTAESLRHYVTRARPPARDDENLFLNENGLPMNNKRVQKIMAAIGEEAEISRRLSPHKLRHTFATLSLRYGNNLEYLRLALGHSDIKTTSNSYLAASDADVAVAQRRSSPMANLYK